MLNLRLLGLFLGLWLITGELAKASQAQLDPVNTHPQSVQGLLAQTLGTEPSMEWHAQPSATHYDQWVQLAGAPFTQVDPGVDAPNYRNDLPEIPVKMQVSKPDKELQKVSIAFILPVLALGGWLGFLMLLTTAPWKQAAIRDLKERHSKA